MWEKMVRTLATMGHMQRVRAQEDRERQERNRAKAIKNLPVRDVDATPMADAIVARSGAEVWDWND